MNFSLAVRSVLLLLFVWGGVLYCSEKSDQLEDSQASWRGATFCIHPHSRRQHIIYSETFAERMCVDDDFYIYAIVHCLCMESVWDLPDILFIPVLSSSTADSLAANFLAIAFSVNRI